MYPSQVSEFHPFPPVLLPWHNKHGEADHLIVTATLQLTCLAPRFGIKSKYLPITPRTWKSPPELHGCIIILYKNIYVCVYIYIYI